MFEEDVFKDIKGYLEVKDSLNRVIDMLNNPKKYKDLGCDMIKGLLLYGPPGTGKTSFAYDLINSINCPNYLIRRDGTDEHFNNLLNIKFDEAIKNAPSIILLDDLDKFSTSEIDDNIFTTVQSLIDKAKNYDVLVVATTNFKDKLPSSLRRKGRFDLLIEVPTPNEEDSYEILSQYLTTKKIDKDVNIKRVSNIISGFSCAEIESVCKKAGLYAGYNNQETIKMNDIVKASLELLYGGDSDIFDEDVIYNNEQVAYHEAGHAIIANYFNPGSIRFISISKNYVKRGIIVYHDSKNDNKTELSEKAHLIRVLGGKAATEVVFNECDLGANSDLHKAFAIARNFVDAYCLDGFDCWFQSDEETSEMTKSNKDKKSSEMVRNYYNKAKEILIAKRDVLDKLAKKLIKSKILYEDEINKILNNKGDNYGNIKSIR